MGLDTSLTDNQFTEVIKTGGNVVQNISDNITKSKISNNLLAGKIDDNKLAAFTGVLNTTLGVVNGLISVVNTGINAYKEIQISRDQVRIAHAFTAAYVKCEREKTYQVEIQQKQETVRYLAKLKADLESKRMDLQKFETELADRQKDRAIEQEKWRRKIDHFESITKPLIEYANILRTEYLKSNFENEKVRTDLQNLDEKLLAYTMQINEIYK